MRRLLTCLPVIFLLMPFTVSAQQAPALEMPDSADVRIIVDISGSMKTNDPDNLRRPAVRLLARMLPAGASAGVWTFGQYVNMLVPHGEVSDDWRGLAITRSDEINSVALRTNLGEAIRVASDPYLLGTEDLSNTDFILLTDGKVDISADAGANEQERERILGPLLEELSARGATLHTVALSRDADLGLLEALADETGGSYSLAASADALTLAFLEALNTAVPQQQIPIEGKGFTVDDGVEEFTALIFRAGDESPADRELALVTPGGTEATPESVIDGMRWVRETEYDLITVTGPEAGDWKINGELGKGSRVTVVSDLRMVVSPIPPTFTEGEPISLQVAFFEEDQKIENPDFLGVIDVSVTLTSDDGRSGSKTLSTDQPPEDGVYTDTITRLPDAGEYQLSVVADGQTFSRRFSAATRYVLPEGLAAPTDPVNEAEEVVQEEPAPDEAEPPAAEPGPIDISQAEEPQPEPEPAEEQPVDDTAVEQEGSPASESDDASAIPVWMMAAAGGLGLIVIAGAVFLVMRRKKPEPEQEEPDEEPPVVAEEAAEEEEIPVAEPEPEEPPEPEPNEEIREDESEDQKLELPEDEIPVADTEVEEGDDEFGLEDFDLSEFDDLPDTEDEQGALDDEGEPDDDDESKKDR
ncbi:hypothetical protein NLU14_09355 [Marinobacter sp. 71-i]|uniref:VWFA domain-containing protein n=1 Tax=Marinobacter iranensis TaxID=2962607 RepID=A0ABT5Y9T4_9GAMM|nr:hypothetical protein [Marinobacter iranensis]MDF0750438.1 hypothetical protein [Marinobacter iranensis]